MHPAGEEEAPRAGRLVGFLPFALFLSLLLVTFDRWVVPFRDSGGEVSRGRRLLDGEVLYRDVVSWFGPLPPLLDALALSIRDHLDSLVALRVGLALLGVAALLRVFRLVTGQGPLAAALASLVVAGCFFLPCGGAVPFPYSVAALEGAVGCWAALALALGSASPRASFAAALVAGLAGGTKLEVLPAALLSIGPALLLRRPRREAVLATLLAAATGTAAWVGPVLLFGTETMTEHGYLIAGEKLRSLGRFYGDLALGGYGVDPSEPARLLAWGLSAAVVVLAARLSRDGGRAPAAALFLLGLSTAVLPGTRAFSVLVPAALVLLAVVATQKERFAGDAGLLCLGMAMLVPLARQPFAAGENPYTPFSAPLALAFTLAWLARAAGRRPAFAAFVFGLAAAQATTRVLEVRADPRVLATFSRARLRLPASEARLLTELVGRLEGDTPPRSHVAAFPDGGLVLYLADRRAPFPVEQFHPGAQASHASREVLRLLEQKPVAAAFFLNRQHPEYGAGVFGFDYGREVLAAFRRRLPREELLGVHAPAQPCVLADQALYLLPARAP